MRAIDTHCHPQFPQYDEDRDAVIRQALDAGVGMICVGTDLRTSEQALELAERYEGLYASVGLHPNDNLKEEYDQHSYLELARHPKVVAIGEVGLDYFRTKKVELQGMQKKRFKQQLELARIVDKPVIVHCRDAHEDMITILQESNRAAGIEKRTKIRGVIHSFNGSVDQARAYIEEGLYIGLNAIITFSSQYEEMVRSLPSDRILLETDAPYLAPAPHRGKRNEPQYVDILGAHIATIRSIPLDTMQAECLANAVTLFSI